MHKRTGLVYGRSQETEIPLPRRPRRDYRVGQVVKVTRRNSDGIISGVRELIITAIYPNFVRCEIQTRSGSCYSECFRFFDLDMEGTAWQYYQATSKTT